MATRTARFKQADVTRLIRGTMKAGYVVTSLEVLPDGGLAVNCEPAIQPPFAPYTRRRGKTLLRSKQEVQDALAAALALTRPRDRLRAISKEMSSGRDN